ncbi:hypothetical protein BXZ70DRAFT_269815 [Cristinia sonorae]|uniref:Methyltransferase-domain-containing protein n=1 Tax=Cristinia sonorae TaxID=1940300 RepID=A0A8K0UYE3_9AGAR|nr:hypothetical protein BXZ70DRAFT_269815 [Cristinia sonorae]
MITPSSSSSPLPAHQTKHIHQLEYPFRTACFHLSQLDNGLTNGTALWLGAQCLSLYLADIFASKIKPSNLPRARQTVIELGSGIGLTSLAMAFLGFDVLATDLPDVVDSVLSANVGRNTANFPMESGSVQVRTLDWTVPPENWSWSHPSCITTTSAEPPQSSTSAGVTPLLVPPFHLIITSDTVYSATLITPFLRTVHALSALSINASPSKHAPPVYVCLERRDPALIDRMLSEAKEAWHFSVERIPHKKVQKAMKKGDVAWDKADWEGVEIWKLVLQNT